MPSSDVAIRPQSVVPLATLTTLGVGGRARWFTRAATIQEVEAAHRWSRDRGLPLFVLGGGSNLVIADAGIEGLVLQVAIRGLEWTARGHEARVRAGAGEPWDRLVAEAVSHGLAGVECLSGIPGNVGGTPIQNVGAYGQEVSGTIAEVTVFDRTAAQMGVLPGSDCGFGYRTSRFRREDAGRFIVCDVTFFLRPGGPTLVYPDVVRYLQERGAASAPGLDEVRRAVLSIRRQKGMVIDPMDPDTRSVGSFFVNPVVSPAVHASVSDTAGGAAPGYTVPGGIKIPAAWLIEQSGFARGYRDGRVGLSSKHPLAIVNRGGATARDVLALAVRIKRGVTDRFGIGLQPEPAFVGFEGDADVTYLQQESR